MKLLSCLTVLMMFTLSACGHGQKKSETAHAQEVTHCHKESKECCQKKAENKESKACCQKKAEMMKDCCKEKQACCKEKKACCKEMKEDCKDGSCAKPESKKTSQLNTKSLIAL